MPAKDIKEQGKTLIYSCACSTNLGLLAQGVANEFRDAGMAEIIPLPDPFGDDTEFKKNAATSKLNIALDGCHVGCAAKALKCRKIKHVSVCLTDYGCEKNKTALDKENLKLLFHEIKQKIGEHCA
ncbi:MAG: putative zinc-binding protein [Candidatus Delongbacteria bacterium]|nr:putative zinc-binding protein [Candidatus Delongbacteria bacterium]MDD4204650.1 putative zinc-binding protein [Candidatus Delongbacteria bacterium]